MEGTRKYLIFGAGVATGALLFAGAVRLDGEQERAIERWISGKPSARTDRIVSTQAQASAPSSAQEGIPHDVRLPAPSSIPAPVLEAWLKTLPYDLLRQVQWAQESALYKLVSDRYPRPKDTELEAHQTEFYEAVRSRGDRPGAWIGESSISAGGKNFDLTFFFRLFDGGADWNAPLDLSAKKPDTLCAFVAIYARGDGQAFSTMNSNCDVGITHVRDGWYVSANWRIDAIEKSYFSYAFAFPPIQTSGATFELFGKDYKWTTASSINWQQTSEEEFKERQAKLNSELSKTE